MPTGPPRGLPSPLPGRPPPFPLWGLLGPGLAAVSPLPPPCQGEAALPPAATAGRDAPEAGGRAAGAGAEAGSRPLPTRPGLHAAAPGLLGPARESRRAPQAARPAPRRLGPGAPGRGQPLRERAGVTEGLRRPRRAEVSERKLQPAAASCQERGVASGRVGGATGGGRDKRGDGRGLEELMGGA